MLIIRKMCRLWSIFIIQKQIILIFRCTGKLYMEESVSHRGIIKSLLIMVFKRDHRDYKSDGLMGVHFDYEAALFSRKSSSVGDEKKGFYCNFKLPKSVCLRQFWQFVDGFKSVLNPRAQFCVNLHFCRCCCLDHDVDDEILFFMLRM